MIDREIHDCDPWEDIPGPECWDCGEHDKEMACVRDDLKDLIGVLYRGGEIRLDEIERCIDQLCHRTGLMEPKENLVDIYTKPLA